MLIMDDSYEFSKCFRASGYRDHQLGWRRQGGEPRVDGIPTLLESPCVHLASKEFGILTAWHQWETASCVSKH